LTQKLKDAEIQVEAEQEKSEQNRQRLDRIRTILDENGGAEVRSLHGVSKIVQFL
jgi:hypothetical protein